MADFVERHAMPEDRKARYLGVRAEMAAFIAGILDRQERLDSALRVRLLWDFATRMTEIVAIVEVIEATLHREGEAAREEIETAARWLGDRRDLWPLVIRWAAGLPDPEDRRRLVVLLEGLGISSRL